MANKARLRLVQVEWLDHCEADGNAWMTAVEAGACRPAPLLSVGWLVHDGDGVLVLSGSVSEIDDTVSRPLVLVRACVKSVVDLA